MAIARYLVDNVDACVAFYVEHLGFREGTRMGSRPSVVTTLSCG
jgi:catechol 2,3-dioxygenase-like lactoylglutathione lyase family enzyme